MYDVDVDVYGNLAEISERSFLRADFNSDSKTTTVLSTATATQGGLLLSGPGTF